MAHTYALGQARTSSAANPVTFSYTVAPGDTVICLLIKGTGATNRAGGAPDWGGNVFTQANSTQKAVTSPEASCEIWYLLNPLPGTQTLTIPNTGAITLKYTVVIGRAAAGGKSAFDAANGGNATSTNPTPGAVTVSEDGSIAFAITAGGWTTWAPSAQVGTVIANTDDGADGGGEQYSLVNLGSLTLSWTFATSDDWGAVVAVFKEVPPQRLNNYMAIEAGSGISVTEKIR
jgi:hypothetical protein